MTICPNCGTQYQEIVDCANHMRNQHHYSVGECREFVLARINRESRQEEKDNANQR